MLRRSFLLVGALFLVGSPALAAQSEPTVVFLVRHAERAEDGTNDPPISDEGRNRALLLADVLEDAGISAIHTTDYIRTRETGRPLADRLGIAMDIYDPADLSAFALALAAQPGHHLVLGHSNTTPDLVRAFGGDPGPPIGEMEYDRGYVVVIRADGAVGSAIFRYGSSRR